MFQHVFTGQWCKKLGGMANFKIYVRRDRHHPHYRNRHRRCRCLCCHLQCCHRHYHNHHRHHRYWHCHRYRYQLLYCCKCCWHCSVVVDVVVVIYLFMFGLYILISEPYLIVWAKCHDENITQHCNDSITKKELTVLLKWHDLTIFLCIAFCMLFKTLSAIVIPYVALKEQFV